MRTFILYLLSIAFMLAPSITYAAPADASPVLQITADSPYLNMDYQGSVIYKDPKAYGECLAFTSILKNQPADFYVSINGSEFKVGSYTILTTNSSDENNVKTDAYNIRLNLGNTLKTETDYLSLNCFQDMNSASFAYIGPIYGKKNINDPTISKTLNIYQKNKDLKKIATSGKSTQTNSAGDWGGYTYTTTWKPEFALLDENLVFVTEHVNSEPKTNVQPHVAMKSQSYADCINGSAPFCLKKSGDKLVVFARIGYGSDKLDFWVPTGFSASPTPSASAPSAAPSENIIAKTGIKNGEVIKTTGGTQMYYIDNGFRRPFPNTAVYQTWYKNNKNVKQVSAQQVMKIPLGKPVSIKPGASLLKFASDPKIYEVTSDSVILYLSDSSVIKQKYGSNWKRRTIELPEIYSLFYTQQ